MLTLLAPPKSAPVPKFLAASTWLEGGRGQLAFSLAASSAELARNLHFFKCTGSSSSLKDWNKLSTAVGSWSETTEHGPKVWRETSSTTFLTCNCGLHDTALVKRPMRTSLA